jgi:hypothetical protein
MGIDEAERLQQEIDAITLAAGDAPRIVLEHGSECTDLTANVALRVFFGPAAIECRRFTIVATHWLHQLLNDQRALPDWLAATRDIYCTGGPLVVVREINADVVVRAVIRYLEVEGA